MWQSGRTKRTAPIPGTHEQQAHSPSLPVSTSLFLGSYKTPSSTARSSLQNRHLPQSQCHYPILPQPRCHYSILGADVGSERDLSSSKSEPDDNSGSCRFLLRDCEMAKRIFGFWVSLECIGKSSLEGRSLLTGRLLLRETVAVNSGVG
jgi:hypothetical protein